MESLPQIDEGVLQNLNMPQGPRLTFMKAKKQLLEQKSPRTRRVFCDMHIITTLTPSRLEPPPPAKISSGPGSLPSLPQTSAHLINFSDITMGPLLGKGFFAEVRQGEWRGTPIAVKIIYRESFRNKGDIELFYQEAEILSKLRFPNIVQFLGICVGDTHCIVTVRVTAALYAANLTGPTSGIHERRQPLLQAARLPGGYSRQPQVAAQHCN